MTSFLLPALTQTPPRELRPSWGRQPIHPPSRAPASARTAAFPRGSYRVKPHRLFPAVDRARTSPTARLPATLPRRFSSYTHRPPAQPAAQPPRPRTFPPQIGSAELLRSISSHRRDDQLPPCSLTQTPPACQPPCPAGSAPAPTVPPAQPAAQPPRPRTFPPQIGFTELLRTRSIRRRDDQRPPASLTQLPPRELRPPRGRQPSPGARTV